MPPLAVGRILTLGVWALRMPWLVAYFDVPSIFDFPPFTSFFVPQDGGNPLLVSDPPGWTRGHLSENPFVPFLISRSQRHGRLGQAALGGRFPSSCSSMGCSGKYGSYLLTQSLRCYIFALYVRASFQTTGKVAF